MARIEKKIIVKGEQGLHARPAASFVQIVSSSNSDVKIHRGEDTVDGKSIMGILTLGVQKGTELLIEVEGDDAEQVIEQLEELLLKN